MAVQAFCAKSSRIFDLKLAGKRYIFDLSINLPDSAMAISSMASVAQPSAQMAQQQMRLMQAQRGADDAERQARSLQAQVQTARSEVTRAQQQARTLEGQLDQADSRAGRARQDAASVKSQSTVNAVSQMEQQLTSGLESTVQIPQATTPPVVNTQGQVTGRFINATA